MDITDDIVQAALDRLRNCDEAAEARANVKHLAEFLKVKKAQLAAEYMNGGTSAAKAENLALADPAYQEVLDGYKVAVKEDCFHQFKREAAITLIDAWRTKQSNARAEGRIG